MCGAEWSSLHVSRVIKQVELGDRLSGNYPRILLDRDRVAALLQGHLA